MHTAANPAYPTTHRATTQGRLLGADLAELTDLGYDPTGSLATLPRPDTSTIRDRAARGELTTHDLLDALALDALRNPRT